VKLTPGIYDKTPRGIWESVFGKDDLKGNEGSETIRRFLKQVCANASPSTDASDLASSGGGALQKEKGRTKSLLGAVSRMNILSGVARAVIYSKNGM